MRGISGVGGSPIALDLFVALNTDFGIAAHPRKSMRVTSDMPPTSKPCRGAEQPKHAGQSSAPTATATGTRIKTW
jgi:hypothetical protein